MIKLTLLALASLLSFAGLARGQATASEGTITLPTYLEGLPSSNAPFDQLYPPSTAPIYPYTWRTSFTDKKVDHAWRTLILENEYLRCTFLPDLGGHLYTCLDKLSGKDMFYANPVVKKNWAALRGAFAALGVEFDFPVGHSWTTVSPVDSAMHRNRDGSATVVISSIDRVTGMQWRVDSTLRPGVDFLEQKVTLYNRSEVRHRYSWWCDAAILVEDASTRFVMPAALSATHSFSEVDTWPVNSAGVDLSVVGNIKSQLGLFAHGSREPFLAVYQPSSRTGTIHYADPAVLPGKKIWAWGKDGDAWVRKSLSDNGTTYVEIQAGLFRNQETFQFLEPQQTRTFTEYWLPARNLGGISRANLSAVVNLQRSRKIDGKIDLTVEAQAYRRIPKAAIRILDGEKILLNETADLDPATNMKRKLSGLPASHLYRLQIIDPSGKILLAHTEGVYDALTAREFKIGKQPATDYSVQTSEMDFLNVAKQDELTAHLDSAYADYQRGLEKFPESSELLKGAGRLSILLNRFQEAAERLERAHAKSPADPEISYYLGVAYTNMGSEGKAHGAFSAVVNNSATARSAFAHSNFVRPANLQMAAALSRAGNWAGALKMLRTPAGLSPDQTDAGAMEVAFLRHLGRLDEAKSRLKYWQASDSSDLLLRFEVFRLGANDPAFFQQLAADPERVLNIATHLFDLGFFDDSLTLTDRQYPAVDSLDAEPGAVSPQDYPLVAYYRAYARERLGQAASTEDYRTASQLSILYVFPNRPGSLPVLQAALEQNPDDATAHGLLGSLYFDFRMTDEAIAEWQKARALRKDLPGLQRNLGRALLEIKMDAPAAAEVLKEGLAIDPKNSEMAEALQKAQSEASKFPASQ